MDIVDIIRKLLFHLVAQHVKHIFLENVKKGRNDRPEVDVIIVDSGELEIEYETDAEGKQVPLHAEL